MCRAVGSIGERGLTVGRCVQRAELPHHAVTRPRERGRCPIARVRQVNWQHVPDTAGPGFHDDDAVAERLADEVLSLPIGPQLSDSDVDTILAAVRDAAGGR